MVAASDNVITQAPTAHNISDLLTKAVDRKTFDSLV